MFRRALLVDALGLKLLGGKPSHHDKVGFMEREWRGSGHLFCDILIIALFYIYVVTGQNHGEVS